MGRRSGSALALREFTIDRSGASGASLRIVCRAHGVRAFIRAVLRLDPYLYLSVDHERVRFNQLSLFREEYQTIPIRSVRAVVAGFQRPFGRIVAAAVLLGAAFGWLLTSALWDWDVSLVNALLEGGSSPRDVLWIVENDHWLVLGSLLLLLLASAWQWWRYTSGKQLFFEFEYGGAKARGIRADRTVTQHVDLAKVREAVDVVSDLVTAVGGHTPAPDTVIDIRSGSAAKTTVVDP